MQTMHHKRATIETVRGAKIRKGRMKKPTEEEEDEEEERLNHRKPLSFSVVVSTVVRVARGIFFWASGDLLYRVSTSFSRYGYGPLMVSMIFAMGCAATYFPSFLCCLMVYIGPYYGVYGVSYGPPPTPIFLHCLVPHFHSPPRALSFCPSSL